MPGRVQSRIVLFLKIFLPLALVAAVAVAVLLPRLAAPPGFDFSGFDLTDGMRMAAPRFSGATSSGQPFEMTSQWAQPDSPDPERIELGPLHGWIDLDPARRARVRADGGTVRRREKILDLAGNVVVETSDGYRLTTAAAAIDMAGGTLRAPGPVDGTGPTSAITAGSMRASRRQDGDVIWFEDRVRVVITPAPR